MSYDNRETCATLVPSSCIPYTGYISETIAEDIQCRPNINDILKKLQEVIDGIQEKLGDNTTLTAGCFSFNPATATQKTINQEIITKLCAAQVAIEALEPIDPNTIDITIDLLCLIEESCEPQTTYTLTEILTKLVTKICNLESRIIVIENILNI